MTNNPTPQEIKQYKKDLKRFYAARKAFLYSAIGCFVGAALGIVGMFYGVRFNYLFYQLGEALIILGVIGAVTCFILRAALYNTRISTRKKIIEEYKNSKK